MILQFLSYLLRYSSNTNNTALDKTIQGLHMRLYIDSDGSGLFQGIIHVFAWRG
jgi:hypothetical protein